MGEKEKRRRVNNRVERIWSEEMMMRKHKEESTRQKAV